MLGKQAYQRNPKLDYCKSNKKYIQSQPGLKIPLKTCGDGPLPHIFFTDNISLVPISGVLLLNLLHPGDHDVTGGEHDAPHVAHHLPPRQPQLLTLPLVPRISVKNIFCYLTFNVTI